MVWVRDPVWQFVGAILASISIIVAVLVYYRQRHWAALQYRVVLTPLLTTPVRRDDQIVVKSGEYQFLAPYHVDVSVSNSGNVPIRRDDIDIPLSVDCGARHVVDARISDARSPEMREILTVEIHENQIIIAPCLLNPEDWFILSFLIDDPQDIKLSGRIVGVESINRTSIQKLSSVLRGSISEVAEERARHARVKSRLFIIIIVLGVWIGIIRPLFPAFAVALESATDPFVALTLDLMVTLLDLTVKLLDSGVISVLLIVVLSVYYVSKATRDSKTSDQNETVE